MARHHEIVHAAVAADRLARYAISEGDLFLQQARIGVPAARGDWLEVDRLLAALPSPSALASPVMPLPRPVRELLDRRPIG